MAGLMVFSLWNVTFLGLSILHMLEEGKQKEMNWRHALLQYCSYIEDLTCNVHSHPENCQLCKISQVAWNHVKLVTLMKAKQCKNIRTNIERNSTLYHRFVDSTICFCALLFCATPTTLPFTSCHCDLNCVLWIWARFLLLIIYIKVTSFLMNVPGNTVRNSALATRKQQPVMDCLEKQAISQNGLFVCSHRFTLFF